MWIKLSVDCSVQRISMVTNKLMIYEVVLYCNPILHSSVLAGTSASKTNARLIILFSNFCCSLNVCILHRSSRLYVLQSDLMVSTPPVQFIVNKFRPVINPDQPVYVVGLSIVLALSLLVKMVMKYLLQLPVIPGYNHQSHSASWIVSHLPANRL